jgi:hypothetical protein
LGYCISLTAASIIIGGCSSVYYTDIGITQTSRDENQKADDIDLSKKLMP